MASCRREVMTRKLGNITPKLHLLEEHVVDSIEHFGMGFSLPGEQGMESIHAETNTLNVRFNAIPATLERRRTCAEQHLLAALPQSAALRPKIKPRKRKSAELE